MNTVQAQQITHSLDKLANFASRFGIYPRAYESIAQLELASFDSSFDDVLISLQNRLDLLESIEQEKDTSQIELEKKLFEKALRSNGLRAKDDVKTFFAEGDIIEIYDTNFRQIYSNLQFFKFCSYDLFTLHSRPFFDLYSRDDRYQQQIVDIMTKCFAGYDKTEVFAVEPHLLKEIGLSNRRVFKVHPKWISPLVDENTGQVKACVLTNYCVSYQLAPVST